jgi:trimeric autotransporter adhesin
MPKPHFPAVTGSVWSSIPDGDSGWYIGGDFRAVGGQPRANLAHILKDGSVDDWSADTDGLVLALALDSRTLYVGGAFTTISGQSRLAVAALDAPSGAVRPWHPDPNGTVRAMLLHGQRLYIGGDFSRFDGQPRNHLAAVAIRESRREDEPLAAQPTHVDRHQSLPGPILTPWNPSVEYAEDPPAYVWALTSDERNIFLGGTFSHVSGIPRSCVAEVDPDSGRVLPWAPKIELEYNPYYYVPLVRSMAISRNRLYVGGHFSSVNGSPRNALAAIDTGSGTVEAWDPALVDALPYAEIDAIGVHREHVYVGGLFRTAEGATRENAAAFSSARGTLTDWRPRPNSIVSTLAFADDEVYMGGSFTSAWNWEYRAGLAALDRRTGKLLAWNPGITGSGVNAFAVTESTVYVGGGFWAIGGKSRGSIAAVNAVSGAVMDWNPECNGYVVSLLLNGPTLYVGGVFGEMAGQPRNNVAAVDASSGSLRDWKPETDDLVSSLVLAGDRMILGGWFRRVGGQVRYGLANVDALAGTLGAWNPAVDDVVDALTLIGNKLYVAGGFRTLGGVSRSGLGAVDVTSGSVTDWNPSPGGSFPTTVYALANNGSTVFVGGDFRSLGGTPRGFLAGISATNGSLLTSIPEADGPVWSLAASGDVLFVGGSFNSVGGVPRAGVDAVPIGTAEARAAGALPGVDPGVIVMSLSPNPVRSIGTLEYVLSASSRVTLSAYDLQGRMVASLLDNVLEQAGEHQVPIRTDGWRPGYYFCRLESGSSTSTRKLLVVR